MRPRLPMEAKKRHSGPLTAAVVTATHTTPQATATPPSPPALDVNNVQPHPGFHIKDQLAGNHLLVDTGAFCSVYPATARDMSITNASTSRLTAANGTPIRTYGERDITIRLAGQDYHWTFILADVSRPLLGADFLAHYHLMVDVARQQLIDTESFASLQLASVTITAGDHIHACSPNSAYSPIIQKHAAVFKPELRQTPGTAPKHDVYHHIKTTGPPVHSKFRRLSPEKSYIAKNAFAEMERMGVCTKVPSPWASPLHMTKKSDCT